jgi:tRNA pseudouridine32 synthase/23S rRNA pseudouridine746 synthase
LEIEELCVSLPEKFTFPFYYEPHPLCIAAAEDLQYYLNHQTEWEHNFGHIPGKSGEVNGKMFGVPVVQNQAGELGYLAAFSGKLAGKNEHTRFVPPVFDTLQSKGFFKKEEEQLSALNRQIESLENAPELIDLEQRLTGQYEQLLKFEKEGKEALKKAGSDRDAKRKSAIQNLSDEALSGLLKNLSEESKRQKTYFKRERSRLREQCAGLEELVGQKKREILALKEERKRRSALLQQKLFDSYTFLNIRGEKKSLTSIFELTADKKPPAGAGECAAPKLLQYAFIRGYRPVSMAEFWWGQSPASEIRIHGHFYPACRGKCEPILLHMLSGIPTDENPMWQNPAEGKDFDIVFEDEVLLAVNKPAGFLSVPGKLIQDSVYSRLKRMYPDATGPLVVHRLDQSTSGLMLIAKTKDIHKKLQIQFIGRSIQKRYIALLEGNVEADEGFIDLPLRVDLDDRPRQVVCYEFGKNARTRFEVIERKNGFTRVYFYPVTGRTHQLRVHAAHRDGLGCPIVGDDLYGNKAKRLHLHAERLEFLHPVTRQKTVLEVPPGF